MPNFLGPFSEVFDLGGSVGGGAVVAPVPQNTTAPVVSGTPTSGQTLTTTNGTWSNTPTGYTYQWRRGGVNISGATASSYTLVLADVGATISVAVTATNANGSTTATSAESAAVTEGIVKPQDVISINTYTGNGGTLDITNGFDYTTQRILSWVKCRSSAQDHVQTDTVRGLGNVLSSSRNVAENGLFGPFNITGLANGKRLQSGNNEINGSGLTYVSYDLVEKPKFLSIVTWLGDGTAVRQIPHSLGVVPGMIEVKAVTSAQNWPVWHRSLPDPNNSFLVLNLTNAAASAGSVFGGAPTASVFTVGNGNSTNLNGVTYIAYVFAQNPDLIDCGNCTFPASGDVTVTLPWEPQLVIAKPATTTGNWRIVDSARSAISAAATADAILYPNAAASEANLSFIRTTATGFTLVTQGAESANQTWIYMAIRKAY